MEEKVKKSFGPVPHCPLESRVQVNLAIVECINLANLSIIAGLYYSEGHVMSMRNRGMRSRCLVTFYSVSHQTLVLLGVLQNAKKD